jgi:transglycosylase-like protein with SLT domain
MRSFFGCLLLCLGVSAVYIVVLVPPVSTSSRRPAVPESLSPPVELWQASTQPADEPDEPEDARKPVATREEICNSVASAAQAHDLPISFLASLVWQESRFNWQAVSPVGAVGIAQFMPEVGKAVGLADPFNPLQAIHVSAKFLRELHEQFGNLGLAAAAYNAGPKRVLDWMASRGSLPAETRTYVLNITGRPAEQWVTKIDNTAFKIPARTPCQSFASLWEWSSAGTGELTPDLPDVAAVPLPAKKPMIAISRNNLIEAKSGEQPTKTITTQPMSIVAANLRAKTPGRPVPAQRTAAR